MATPFVPTASPLPDDDPGLIGRSLPRREDDALLRGAGRYVDDLAPPGCLHGVFVRSPYPRARLVAVDPTRAGAMPGVRLVLTGATLDHPGSLPVNPIIEGIRAFTSPVLAVDRVNCVGAPIALVVADSVHAARDAAEAVAFECEPLLPYVDPVAARAGEPLLPDWPDNCAFEKHWRYGDCESAFAEAHRVVHAVVECPRVAPVALEPRGMLAHWAADQLTVWIPTQSPHRARTQLAQLLDLDVEQVRTIAPDVGGAFGGKASIYPEDVAVAHAAMRLGLPVKWIATRNEEMISATHGRAGRIEATAGFAADGKLLGVRAEAAYALGSWGTFSAAVPAVNAARILPGPYRVAAVDITTRGYVTNTAAVGIYRGAGRPEAALVMERLMDAGAAALELDPATIRRCNVVTPEAMPYRTPTGQTLDSGDYADLLEHTLARADYDVMRSDQLRRRRAGELVGIGLNLYVEPCGAGWEGARLTRHPDGRFTVASGSSAQGQGHRTAYAQIAAATLGVPIGHVDVIEGDSASAPAGIGALASRSMAIGGSAVREVALAMRAKLESHGTAPDAAIVTDATYTAPAEAWSAGCCIVVVRIDRQTGVLAIERAVWSDDAGVVINPLLAEGQMVGGFAQGLGQAMMERVHYDPDGQITTGSLLDYALPRAVDMPPLTLDSRPSATRANALGAKGIGESGCIAAPAAILNAAIDALSPLGVSHLDMPLTSESLWRAITNAQSSGDQR